MSRNADPDHHAEFPFAALLRANDRERLRVHLMASVWGNILGLPIQARDGAEADAPGPEDLSEAEVGDGWDELAKTVGGDLKAWCRRVPAEPARDS